MFSGIIGALGTCVSSSARSGGRELVVSCPAAFLERVETGASIAINGVCQTVTAATSDRFTIFASDETLGCTNLGRLASGARVHLERALAASGRFDGHIVSGHVDCVARIARFLRRGENIEFTVRLPDTLAPLVATKGSLAVDGVSLTVHEVKGDEARFVIIPGSVERTLIGQWQTGHEVNLEADLVARYVARWLTTGHRSGDASLLRTLAASGREPDMRMEE